MRSLGPELVPYNITIKILDRTRYYKLWRHFNVFLPILFLTHAIVPISCHGGFYGKLGSVWLWRKVWKEIKLYSRRVFWLSTGSLTSLHQCSTSMYQCPRERSMWHADRENCTGKVRLSLVPVNHYVTRTYWEREITQFILHIGTRWR
jgi:hypothetical protein